MDISRKIEQLEFFLEQDKDNLNLMLDLIYLSLDASSTDAAENYLYKAQKLHPESSQLIYLSGLISCQKKDFEQALSSFNSLLGAGVCSADILYQAAYCNIQLDNPESALELLLSASEQSQETEIVYLLARTQYQLKNFELAVSTLTSLADRNAKYAPAHSLLSQIYMDIEQWEDAQTSAAKALALDSNNVTANITLGFIELNSNQYDQAAGHFSQALNVNDESCRTHLGLAIIDVFQQRYVEAEQHLLSALSLQNDLLPAINLLGWLYLLTDRFDLAREVFDKGIAVDRSYAEMYGGIAIVDILEKDETAARKNVAVALRLDKMSYAGNFAKILLLQNAQRLSQAEKVWKNLISSPIDETGKTLEQAVIEQIRAYLKVTLH
jgi:tetratricopeptide (TPR) repeat protein